jgi:multidrug efflux system outer membrane protein
MPVLRHRADLPDQHLVGGREYSCAAVRRRQADSLAEKAGAQRDQAAFAYRGTALTAISEVEKALASVQRLDEQLVMAIAQRDSLSEQLRIATNRYRDGYAGYLDQLDAQRNLLSAELGVVQLRADTLAARVTLYEAIGGGWSADMINKADAD